MSMRRQGVRGGHREKAILLVEKRGKIEELRDQDRYEVEFVVVC